MCAFSFFFFFVCVRPDAVAQLRCGLRYAHSRAGAHGWGAVSKGEIDLVGCQTRTCSISIFVHSDCKHDHSIERIREQLGWLCVWKRGLLATQSGGHGGVTVASHNQYQLCTLFTSSSAPPAWPPTTERMTSIIHADGLSSHLHSLTNRLTVAIGAMKGQPAFLHVWVRMACTMSVRLLLRTHCQLGASPYCPRMNASGRMTATCYLLLRPQMLNMSDSLAMQ